jgi:ABC-type transport system involved in multi-copper enzyme maturation permease subunit
MATTTAQAARPAALPAPHGRAGLAGALRSEFTKIRSVRSTFWTLLAVIVVTVGLGALFSWGTASHWNQASPADRATFDATATSLAGLILSQLVIVVLGALTITSEHSTGMIRTSLTAMPRRGVVYAAKAMVFTAVALVAGWVSSFGAFFLGQALLSGQHINVTLAQPHVLRAVIGGGLFLAACGLLALGIGAALRHTAGAITASIGLLFVLFILANFLPESWRIHVSKWLPFNAGSQIWMVRPGEHMFSAWTGFAVFCVYTAIALLAGLTVFLRRDA